MPRRPLSPPSADLSPFSPVPLGATAVLAALLLGAGPAAADPFPGDLRPTRGIELPTGGVSGDADATALELNPAQLGLLRGGSLALAGSVWPDAAVRPGRGLGLFLAGSLFGRSGLGVGIEWLRPTIQYLGGEVPRSYGKFVLGYGLRLGRRAALGVSWARFFGDNPLISGASTWDFGLSWRVHRMVALGAAWHDAISPQLGDGGVPYAGGAVGYDALQWVWDGEVAVRPTGTDRLEVGLGYRFARSKEAAPHFRLAARLRDGLRVFAATDMARRDFNGDGVEENDLRGTVGLWLDLDHAQIAAAGVGGTNGGTGTSSGGAFLLRMTSERFPSLTGGKRIDRIRLTGLDGDRAFTQLVLRLRRLADDPDSAGVLLVIDELELGYGRIEELRDLVARIRQADKRVIAYLLSGSMREYYLASACDLVLMHPTGELALSGVAQEVTFYKQALDKLGVAVDLVRIAEYKGAGEPFILDDHTEPVRRNREELLDDVFGRVVSALAEDRKDSHGLDAAGIRKLVDKGFFDPPAAAKAGLLDGVVASEELEDWLRKQPGLKGVSVHDADESPMHEPSWESPRVAVVLVDGNITGGRSETFPGLGSTAGSDTIVQALDDARHDASVRAVVLRVNSPGGSSDASDFIARAVKQLRKAGKPVVVSMGDVAASGGYYISAPGEEIFAEPSTTTGSIGIFALKADVQNLLARIGVSVTTYRRGEHADLFTMFRPWTEDERKIVADRIRYGYDQFLETIAAGRRDRGLTTGRIDEIGRGHVWTGWQAHGLGLVDHRGGLGAAIDRAASLAKIPRGVGGLPEVVVLPRRATNFVLRMAGLGSGAADDGDGDGSGDDDERSERTVGPARLVEGLLGLGGRSTARLLLPLLHSRPGQLEARMPYELELR